MIKRKVKAEDMRPNRRYTIEIPANFAVNIRVAYNDPSWTEAFDSNGMFADALEVIHKSITLEFTDLRSGSSGMTITEYIDWETGSVYKSKLTGKLYQRESDGWICLKYQGQSSYGIPDIGARTDFESSLVKLTEEK